MTSACRNYIKAHSAAVSHLTALRTSGAETRRQLGRQDVVLPVPTARPAQVRRGSVSQVTAAQTETGVGKAGAVTETGEEIKGMRPDK